MLTCLYPQNLIGGQEVQVGTEPEEPVAKATPPPPPKVEIKESEAVIAKAEPPAPPKAVPPPPPVSSMPPPPPPVRQAAPPAPQAVAPPPPPPAVSTPKQAAAEPKLEDAPKSVEPEPEKASSMREIIEIVEASTAKREPINIEVKQPGDVLKVVLQGFYGADAVIPDNTPPMIDPIENTLPTLTFKVRNF
jgi:hypothetical protein